MPLELGLLCLLLSYGYILAGAMSETDCCLRQWPMKRLAGDHHNLAMLYVSVCIVRQHSALLTTGSSMSSKCGWKALQTPGPSFKRTQCPEANGQGP